MDCYITKLDRKEHVSKLYPMWACMISLEALYGLDQRPELRVHDV